MLNGTEGVNQAVAGVVGQGLSIYETLRKALVVPTAADGRAGRAGRAAGAETAAPSSNGSADATAITA